jgi:hypothetical protein
MQQLIVFLSWRWKFNSTEEQNAKQVKSQQFMKVKDRVIIMLDTHGADFEFLIFNVFVVKKMKIQHNRSSHHDKIPNNAKQIKIQCFMKAINSVMGQWYRLWI